MAQTGKPYFSSIDDPKTDPATVALLNRLGKSSDLGVAIEIEGTRWGGIWATTEPGVPELPRRGSALPRGGRRADRRRDLPGRDVLPGLPPRLRGRAHRPRQPARRRGAARARHRPLRRRRDRALGPALRRRPIEVDQRHPRPRRRRRGAAQGGGGADRLGGRLPGLVRRPDRRRRVLRPARDAGRGRG